MEKFRFMLSDILSLCNKILGKYVILSTDSKNCLIFVLVSIAFL